MATVVRDVMSPFPITVVPECTIQEAAERMRDGDIGDVIVQDGDTVLGIVTDRDIVIRAVADDVAPSRITVGEICSPNLVMVGPNDQIGEAAELMREAAVRRIPVVEAGRAVGVVSLGDLAIEYDPSSPLADISATQPNR